MDYVKVGEQPFWQHFCKNPRTERNGMNSNEWKVGISEWSSGPGNEKRMRKGEKI